MIIVDGQRNGKRVRIESDLAGQAMVLRETDAMDWFVLKIVRKTRGHMLWFPPEMPRWERNKLVRIMLKEIEQRGTIL
jgi:hypothetical protein